MEHKVHSANQDCGPFYVEVAGEGLGFAAAHFTATAEEVEPLHGHNYRAKVRLWSSLAPEGWVMDFRQLRKVATSLCRPLDHRLLLPGESPFLLVCEEGKNYRVEAGGKTYLFPKEDCLVLPLPNTTAELLAQWLGGQLLLNLPQGLGITRVAVGVEEAPGQEGWWSCNLCQGGGHEG